MLEVGTLTDFRQSVRILCVPQSAIALRLNDISDGDEMNMTKYLYNS